MPIDSFVLVSHRKKKDVILQFATQVYEVNMQKKAFECRCWYLAFQREVSIKSEAKAVFIPNVSTFMLKRQP